MMMIGLVVRRIATTMVGAQSVTMIDPCGFAFVHGSHSFDRNGSGFLTACINRTSAGFRLRKLVVFPVPDWPRIMQAIDIVCFRVKCEKRCVL